ncbi:MAG: hypothetical protein SFV55_00180 [Haliscomenobacter sp.]|uniref:hypothetical protein n=1 Tax=Haliscomenobacter sp. TaxID=2717303 RepID=UPI0029B56D59|nr:hypothetical protein [Haliscomenobacter sp.]MDX2066805.1 hypothetical protein [Haliscomenobacter sp.]
MYFLFTNICSAHGVQLSPTNLVYSGILLSSALGALLMTQIAEGLEWYILVPILALIMVWKIPDWSYEFQTSLGVLTVIVAVVLLFVLLPPQVQQYTLQGISTDEWNKFRAFIVALPCMCIMLRIVNANPSQLNLLLFGIPMVVCAGFSVYALRILLG